MSLDSPEPAANSEDLRLRFDPLTIGHLGSNMYSKLPNAVAELVANAYDADAKNISVQISGTGTGQQISVTDDGHGMSTTDMRDKYLRIGRNRRGGAPTGKSESGTRTVSGKKGLGKLALFGIGHEIQVQTKRSGTTDRLSVEMVWQDIAAATGDYKPTVMHHNASPDEHGTVVTVSKLTRTTNVSAADLAASLSRLFQYSDAEVSLTVRGRLGDPIAVTRDLRISSMTQEFSWNLPNDLPSTGALLKENGIHGKIVAGEKPLATHMRGITVYSNGRLANEPEFFGAADSSYAYAYLTGFVTVDALDSIRPDVVATDRRAVNWDHPDATELRKLLRSAVEEIAQLRRALRSQKKKAQVAQVTGIDTEAWTESIKGPQRSHVVGMIDLLESEDADMSDGMREAALENLKGIAPPHADLIWRNLHPSIQGAVEVHFKAQNYYQALLDGIKRYVSDLRTLSSNGSLPEMQIFDQLLGEGKGPRFRVAQQWLTSTPFLTEESVKNLENGQRELSKALWTAFRHALAHEDHSIIEDLEIFSYRNCLDALSIISLLRERIESGILADPSTETA